MATFPETIADSTSTNAGIDGSPQAEPIKSLDKDPNKFLFYGVTYLLATPSHYNLEVSRHEDLIRAFLKKAEVDKDRHDEVVKFTQRITSDEKLTIAMKDVNSSLQTAFGGTNVSYSPTPCPTEADSLKIMAAMAMLSILGAQS
jgi:hypothetical protein